MNDLIHASYEGICLLRLDRRDQGSTTSLQNHKTLQGWWCGSCKKSEQAEDDSEGRMIERGVHVMIRVRGGDGNIRGIQGGKFCCDYNVD